MRAFVPRRFESGAQAREIAAGTSVGTPWKSAREIESLISLPLVAAPIAVAIELIASHGV
jgi:hypothetical protein